MANELNVKIIADISSLKAGLDEAQAQVKAAAANMAEAQEAFGASAALGNEQARAALAGYAGEVEVASGQVKAAKTALAEATAASADFAAAQGTTAATEDAVTGSTAAEVAALNDLWAASNRQVSGSMAAQGALRTLEGSMFGASRAAGTLLADTLGLGPILSAAFPVIGAVALLSILYQVGEELAKTVEDADNAGTAISQAFGDAQDKLQETNDQLALQNSKLQDEIDKLSGHPNNGLQTALDEDIVAADKLQDALDGVIKQIDAIYAKKDLQIGLGASLLTGRARTGPVTEEASGIVNAAGAAAQSAKQDYDAQLAGSAGNQAKVVAATKAYHEAIQKIIDDANAKLQPSLDENVRMQKAAEEALGEDPAKASIFKRFGTALGEAETGQAVNVADYSARINDLKKAQDLLNQLKTEMEAMEAQEPLEQKKGQLEQQHAEVKATPEVKVGPSKIAEELKRQNEAAKRQVAEDQRVLDDLTAIDQKFASEQTKTADDLQKSAEKAEQAAAQQAHDQATSALEVQGAKIQQSETLGTTAPGQDLAQLQTLHAQEIAEDEHFIQEEMGIYAKQPEELDRLQKELDAVHQKGLQQQQEDTTKALQKELADFDKTYAVITSDLNSTIDKLITTTQKPAQAFAQMFDKILSQLANFALQWIEKQTEMWLKTEILQILNQGKQTAQQTAQTASVIAAQTAQTAAITTAQTTQTAAIVAAQAIRGATAVAEITSDAGVAAANTMAFYTLTDPPAAPASAAAAFAATEAYAAIGAFEAGGIVSGSHGMPVPIMAHAGERVLSAPQTHNFERLVNQPQGGGQQFHMHYNGQVNAFDRNGMRQTLQSHADDIGDIVKELWNSGKLK